MILLKLKLKIDLKIKWVPNYSVKWIFPLSEVVGQFKIKCLPMA